MEVTTMLTFHIFCLKLSSVYCAVNTKTFDTGPSLVIHDADIDKDVSAISEAFHKDPLDFKAVFDIIACCRSQEQRIKINTAWHHNFGHTVYQDLITRTQDKDIILYLEYMLYDSYNIRASVLRDYLGSNSLHVGVISASGCPDLKLIASAYETLCNGAKMVDDIKNKVKFENDKESSYFKFNSDTSMNCRPEHEGQVDQGKPGDGYKSDCELIPSKEMACSDNEKLVSLMEIHSFAYYKLLITKYIKQDVTDIAGRCNDKNAIGQSIRKILLYSVNPAEFYAAEIHDNCQDPNDPVQVEACSGALRYILQMRNEIDTQEINTLYSKNYKGAKISDLINNLKNYSDLYKYALQQLLAGNRETE